MVGWAGRARPAAVFAAAVVFALSTVLALAVLVRPAEGIRPGPASPPAGPRVPVTSAMLLCPDLNPPTGGTAGGMVTVDVATAGGTVGGSPGADGRIWLSVGGVVRDVPAAQARVRGVSAQAQGGVPVTVHASGPAAAGLSATVTAPGAPGRAPARARCDPPRSEFWFVGPGTITGRDPLVVLTNPETVPARVEIALFRSDARGARATDARVADSTVTDGVSVPPMASVTRRLTDWVPDAEATAVRIRVRDGRLAAAVLDRSGAPFAQDPAVVPVAAGTGPAGSMVLAGTAGVPAGAVGAQVVVAAPEADSMIRLELLTASTRFTPAGLAAVRVPGGGVLRLPALTVGAAASPEGSGAAAVRVVVISGGPVVAGLGLPVGAAPDHLWVGEADVIEPDPAAATLLPAVPEQTLSALVLTAPETAVTVWLDGNVLRIPAGRTVSVGLAGVAGAMRMVTRGGPLVAAQTIGTTGWVCPLTLSAAARTVSAPVLFQDPRVAFRR